MSLNVRYSSVLNCLIIHVKFEIDLLKFGFARKLLALFGNFLKKKKAI